MKTLIHLRPARKADLFDLTTAQIPKFNLVYFLIIGDKIKGQCIFNPENTNEIVWQMYEEPALLYIPTFEVGPTTISVELNLKLATLEELSEDVFCEKRKKIRTNFSYFISDKGGFVGPFQLYDLMDKKELYAFFKESRVYIFDKALNQNMEPLKFHKNAS